MGASTFMNVGEGKTAKDAFRALVERSRREDGTSYSGCVGMKSSFVMIPCLEGKNPREFADELIQGGDRRVADKYGPAGCIKLEEGRWLFFGWASD